MRGAQSDYGTRDLYMSLIVHVSSLNPTCQTEACLNSTDPNDMVRYKLSYQELLTSIFFLFYFYWNPCLQ